MKFNWLIVLGFSLITFAIIKFIIIILVKMLLGVTTLIEAKRSKKPRKPIKSERLKKVSNKVLDIGASASTYLVFMVIYFFGMYFLSEFFTINYSIIDLYAIISIFGISSIIWSYFSWDISKIISKPTWSDVKYLKNKKAIVFTVIFVYAIVMGYIETLNSLNVNSISPFLKIFNYSAVAAAIAFDRILNQLWNGKNK